MFLKKIDAELIAFFQYVVNFIDNFFAISRKTLIRGFVCLNMLLIIFQIYSIISYLSNSIEADILVVKKIYIVLFILHIILLGINFLSLVDGLTYRNDENGTAVVEELEFRTQILFYFLIVCCLIIFFKYRYTSSFDPNFLAFIGMGYFVLLAIFCSLAIEYLICTKSPPPIESKLGQHFS
jgi:hypothetical protein